jgi:7-keto-8-aminopelargonate synthetase-like enzyme
MREQGADVYGFGAQKTPESFRQACRRFIYTENLVPVVVTSSTETPSKSTSLQPRSAAIPMLKKAISQIESEDGWVPLGRVGSQLSSLFTDFDARSYGHSKLSDLVRKTEAFDIETGDGGPRIRARAAGAAAKTKAK